MFWGGLFCGSPDVLTYGVRTMAALARPKMTTALLTGMVSRICWHESRMSGEAVEPRQTAWGW